MSSTKTATDDAGAEQVRVLIVEDEPVDAELMELELRRAGVVSTSRLVDTEDSFLDELAAFRPDIILSDYSLPRFDALRVLELAKERAPLTPVVVVTGALTEETAADCIKAGAADYVIKERMARLVPAVNNALERKREFEQRRRAEQKLRESEARFRAVFDTAQDCIFIKDRDLRYVDVNPAMARLFGTPASELIGRTDEEIFGEETAAHIKETDTRVLNGEIVDEEHTKPVGERQITFHIIKVPIRDSGGNIVALCGIARDITERKQSEERRKAAIAGLHAVIAASEELSACVDEDTLYKRAVELAREKLGLERCAIFLPDSDELRGTYGTDRHGRTTYERANRFAMDRDWPSHFRLTGGEPHWVVVNEEQWDFDGEHSVCFGYGWVVRTPIHGEREVLAVFVNDAALTGAPLDESTQDIVAVYCSMLGSIIKRMRAEEALRESETEKRAILDGISVNIAYVNSELDILWANKTAANSVGKSPEEVIGQKCHKLWADREYPCEGCPTVETFKTKKTARTTMVTPDGRVWDESAEPVFDASGRLTGVVEIAEDITERAHAEETTRRLATAIDQAAEAVVITDTDGTIQYVNPAFERISGYTREEAVGQNPRILKGGTHDNFFYKHLWDTVTGGNAWRGHFINKKKDGSLYEEDAVISPVRDATGKIVNYVAVKRDVTEMVLLERQLEESRRLEAIGTLAGGIAHDFNNILYAMMGFAELAMRRVSPSDQAHKCLEEVIDSGKRAADLVKQIVTFSRQAGEERGPMLLQTVMKEVLKQVATSLPPNIRMSRNIDMECEPVMANATQIHQVVMNLCTNARYAMAEHGGVMSVSLKQVDALPDAAARDPRLKQGKYVRLRVRDTGSGMDNATIERIFDPFFTTRPPGEGTGMGLALVQGIVRGHGGVILVDSTPGEGTTFDAFLPVSAEQVALAREPDEKTPTAGTERVLFVDDEESIVEMQVMSLEQFGYKVTGCVGSREAIEQFSAAPDEFDIVVTDEVMPDMTGMEVAAELSRIRPGIPIILCTGFGREIDEREMREAGINCVIVKPTTQQNFARTVRRVLDKQYNKEK